MVPMKTDMAAGGAVIAVMTALRIWMYARG
jgi:hypothetical protein